MRDLVSQELARLAVKLDRAERRIALQDIPGKVAAVDPDKRLLRLQIGETKDGKPVLSPWVRWQEPAAGGLKVHSQPAIGEQMRLVSQSGTVGSGTIAAPGTYDQDHSAPSQSSESAVFERGQGRIELGPDGILLKGPVRITGEAVTHNGRNIGHDHKHTQVERGPNVSGPPQG
ncbi:MULTISPECIES: phage baseplate assembly protein V [unclassified Ensifer]|uniref:phage baseplate assembly protein V n=1 Tax=unclassified Ensifer TaxID=2633371 RepID=UPI000813D14C|nr:MULTISPECIES: phage baseplate assembly protein V [unclassified Ensifer]OCP17436.1 hypothetical protein BC361_08235 [Ensifer sp. LC54]OCP28658.1 hypothetical protein BC363_02120 [Ensifer sp. LC384]